MEPAELRAVIARNITALVEERGLTLPMLADQAAINTSHLYRVVNEVSSPTSDWLAKIAMTLEVAPSDLLVP